MAHLNRLTLIGRLTDNPEPAKTLPNSGATVTKFRIACGRSKKNPQTGQWENDPNPLFLDCEAFAGGNNRQQSGRNLVDVITQYCSKGQQIYVEGRLQLDQWQDQQSGQKRSKHKMIVTDIQFIDGNRQGGDGGGGGGGNRQQSNQGGGYSPPQDDGGDFGGGDDNIPF